MNFRMLLMGVLLLVSASSALAAGPYVGAAGGISIFHDQDIRYASGSSATAKLETGYGFNVSVGYNIDPVRVEFEFGNKKADVDRFTAGGGSGSGVGSDVTIRSYMANACYDFKTGSSFKPYIGIGMGTVNGEFSSPGFKSHDSAFGYQFMIGNDYAVTKNVALGLSYRLQGIASDFRIKNGTEISYTSSNVMAGLRYNF